MVKIAFALPVPNSKIIGGYKVVYEYANYMASKGCNVTLFYNAHNGENSKHLPRSIVFFLRWRIGKFGPKWHKLDKRIDKKVLRNYDKITFDGFDSVIATATETAQFVNKSNASKWYFVQGFENWERSSEEVVESYKLDLKIIAISKWLQKIIEESTRKEVVYIPNGVDKAVFHEIIAYKDRGIHTLSSLYHWDDNKGSDIALRIIYRLKKKYSDFEAYLFGAPPRNKEWPSWIHYIQYAKPDEVCECMNKTRVFLCTSRQEGFGLTGLESIFSGCCLVTTDCLGIREYASENNSYICSVDDEQALFESVCSAFDNSDENKKKREKCKSVIGAFDSDESKDMFYKVVLGSRLCS